LDVEADDGLPCGMSHELSPSDSGAAAI